MSVNKTLIMSVKRTLTNKGFSGKIGHACCRRGMQDEGSYRRQHKNIRSILNTEKNPEVRNTV